MPIPVFCDECGASYQIVDDAAGKLIRCRDCDGPVRVPGSTSLMSVRQRIEDVRTRKTTARQDEPALQAWDDDEPQLRPLDEDEPELAPFDKPRGPARAEYEAGPRSDADHRNNVLIGAACAGFALLVGACFLIVGLNNDDSSKAGADRRPGEFQTRLVRTGPAPQDYQPVPAAPGVRPVRYESDGVLLKAWVAGPSGPGPHPALLYCHGGFAFGLSDLEDCRPFLDAGFVVMAPTWRGENGNGGNFELMMGEVDDAAAAARWLAQQPNVNSNAIYAFGHSIGGGIAALLSLREDAPLVHTGSCGGLYHGIPGDWADIIPFDATDPQERRERLLIGRLEHMQRDHYAFLGSQDFALRPSMRQGEPGSRLQIRTVSGDHFSSLRPAMWAYLSACR